MLFKKIQPFTVVYQNHIIPSFCIFQVIRSCQDIGLQFHRMLFAMYFWHYRITFQAKGFPIAKGGFKKSHIRVSKIFQGPSHPRCQGAKGVIIDHHRSLIINSQRVYNLQHTIRTVIRQEMRQRQVHGSRNMILFVITLPSYINYPDTVISNFWA